MPNTTRADGDPVTRRLPELPFPTSTREALATSLGGTLYVPTIREHLARDIVRCARCGTRAVVLCLEDSVADSAVPQAELNLLRALGYLADSARDLPNVFVRPRAAEQMARILGEAGDSAQALRGVVVPKFRPSELPRYLDLLPAIEGVNGPGFLMPILESPELAIPGARLPLLSAARDVLLDVQEQILTVRIGATDLSSAYGLRRSGDITIYDVGPVAHAISDIVGVFNPAGFTVSGPVWEHWGTAAAVTGLKAEVRRDLAQGLVGKTLIHPSQVPIVNALLAVPESDLSDARQILSMAGGVAASATGARMNEAKPHAAWARRIILRAAAFGTTALDGPDGEVGHGSTDLG